MIRIQIFALPPILSLIDKFLKYQGMKQTMIMIFMIMSSINCIAQNVSVEMQIKTALLAAPVDKRADATVYGFNDKGKMIVLRQGKK